MERIHAQARWNDELSETLESQKKIGAMLSRSEIQTVFQFIDADEGRVGNGHDVRLLGHLNALPYPLRNGLPVRGDRPPQRL